jgi:class 3 adenylate cyclase
VPRYRFRDKLLLGFAVLLIVTFVPVLFQVNTQIDLISESQIEKDLRGAKLVFERFQDSQLRTYSEQATTFILTQPEVRAEIATFAEAEDNPFADVFGPAGEASPEGSGAEDPFGADGATDADPFADSGGDPFAEAGSTQSPPEPALSASRAGAASALPERQGRILSILQELSFYQSNQVFFLTDYQGRLVFNKADPRLEGERLIEVPAVLAALQGNEIFTWWASLDPRLSGMGLLPEQPGEGRLYQMFLKPVVFGGEIKGVVASGAVMTQDVLRQITGITQADLAFVAGGHIYIGSEAGAFTDEQIPLLTGAGAGVERTFYFERGGEEFLALAVPARNSLGEEVGSAVVYRSKTKEQRIYENLKLVLNVIGVIALLVAAAVALAISFNFSKSVRALSLGVQEVRKGNLDHKVEIRSRDEFGTLSTAFNEMTAGLKEKEAIRSTFKRYVSSSVVDELLKNTDAIALGGEAKQLTIQFSDIVGFTSLSEALSPAQVVEFLNEYLSRMTTEIEAEQGIVDKYIGDAVMAFWGAPLPLEDHALRACRAALRQRAGVHALRRRWADRGDLSRFSIRLGLHTGEVIVGNIGSATRMDYTIIGDAVNTASRLEGLNKLYSSEILISESTRRLAGERMLTRELDLIRPVGKQEPVRIFELVEESGALPAEEAARWAERTRIFEEGLALYREGRFEEALGWFSRAEALGDRPAQTFTKRCQAYLMQPPVDWNGVYVTRSK